MPTWIRSMVLGLVLAGAALAQVVVAPKEAKTMLRTRINPRYPKQAIQVRAQGTVWLTILVGANGLVQGIKAKSGPPIFHDSSADAVRQWIFQPLIQNGQPVPFITDVEFNYEIH
jgi:protein TonB